MANGDEYDGADWLPEGTEREPNYDRPQYEDLDCQCQSPEECEADCWPESVDLTEYEFGDFKVGQRVALTAVAGETRHVGATGTIVRIDSDIDDMILPVIVWLDIFGTQSAMEASHGMGLPVCAKEITLIKEATIK